MGRRAYESLALQLFNSSQAAEFESVPKGWSGISIDDCALWPHDAKKV